jgi:hypothetical protein
MALIEWKPAKITVLAVTIIGTGVGFTAEPNHTRSAQTPQLRANNFKIEKHAKERPVVCACGPILKSFRLPAPDAGAVAKALKAVFKSPHWLTITATAPSVITVWGRPVDHDRIGKQIGRFSDALATLAKEAPSPTDRAAWRTFVNARRKLIARIQAIAVIELDAELLAEGMDDKAEQAALAEIETAVKRFKDLTKSPSKGRGSH